MESKKLRVNAAASPKYSCALCPYSTNLLGHHRLHLAVHSDERPFKCPKCPYRAKQNAHVKTHLTHVHLLKPPSSSRPFPCPHSGCSYAAKQKSDLSKHSKIHSDEKFFSCSHPNCNYSARHKSNLVVHSQIHTGEKPFVCPFDSCSYATAQKSALVKHSRIHTKEKPYKCPHKNCGYSTTLKGNLNSHGLTQHPKDGEERPLFKCPLCEYKGNGKANLSKHIKRHTLEKHLKCDEPNCNFEAKTKSHLKQHKVVHSDEKPFACLFKSCKFRCNRKSNLSTHLKIHSDERRYKCELCPFRGKTRTVVRNHLNNVHSDPEFRPFKCKKPKCESASKTKFNLKRHLLTHAGQNAGSTSDSGLWL